MFIAALAFVISFPSLVFAQYGPGGRYGPGGSGGYNPYKGGGSGGYNPYNGGGSGFNSSTFGRENNALVAHAVLASLAFVVFFPMGSMLIRLGSFRGLWLVHGLFQIFAYFVYIAAFGIGIWMVNQAPVNLIDRYHPIIGIVVFVFMFFQPLLGLVHHFQFKKYGRRTVWSYGHLWLGRILITLGIINGGLGLLLATETGYAAPSTGQIIAYGVVAAIMWLLWVAAAIIGERMRKVTRKVPRPATVHKAQYA